MAARYHLVFGVQSLPFDTPSMMQQSRHISLHSVPTEGLFQVPIHLSYTWMYAKMTFMSLFKNLFSQPPIPKYTHFVAESQDVI